MNIIKKVLIPIFAIVVILVAIPVVNIAKTSSDCTNQKKSLMSANAQTITDFDKFNLISTQPDVKSSDVRGGDCVDSKPYLQIDKSYNVNMLGSEALSDVRANLSKQGYLLTNEKYQMTACGIEYSATASNNSRVATVKLAANDKGSADCYSKSPRNIEKAQFDTAAITFAFIRLEPIY